MIVLICCFFFFKQKTAYGMRISDWRSDLCSSDLRAMNAADLFGPWIEEVATTLEQAATVDEKLVIGNNFAREVLKRDEPAPMWFIRTVDGWLTASASPQVPELVEATGMSIRSVERMTKHNYGLSTRVDARKLWAGRAATALARNTRRVGKRGGSRLG